MDDLLKTWLKKRCHICDTTVMARKDNFGEPTEVRCQCGHLRILPKSQEEPSNE